MEEIIQDLQEWKLIDELPKKVHGFLFEKQLQKKDKQYLIFRYHNDSINRSFSVLYDGATKEFLARIVVGLTEFCDIRFIANKKETLENVLRHNLENTLKDLAYFNIKTIDSIVREKQIIEWPYVNNLPKQIGDFVLFIAPNQPLKVINGSYIIIDYSNFNSQSNLIIYYNIFRDEFFAEMRINRTPHMIADFDAKTLDELQEKIDKKLIETLKSIKGNEFNSNTQRTV